jgi:hypothetical protein
MGKVQFTKGLELGLHPEVLGMLPQGMNRSGWTLRVDICPGVGTVVYHLLMMRYLDYR